MLDMRSCVTDIYDMSVLEGFMKSVCGSYKLNILNEFSSEEHLIIVYTLEDGFFIAKVAPKTGRMFIDLFVTNTNYMPQMQHIKQQALDYYSPMNYTAQMKPRCHLQ